MFPHLPQVFASNPLDPLLWAIDTSRNEVQWQWDQFLGMQSQHDETWPPLWLWSCLMCSHRGWPFCPGVEIKNYHCKTIMTINSFSPWAPWAVALLWGGGHSASATCCPNPAVEKKSVHVSSCFSTICSRCPYGLLGVFRLFSPFIFTCKVHGVFLVALNMKQVNATPNDQVSEGLFAGVSVTIIPIVLPAQVNGIGGFSPLCFFNDGMLFQPGFPKSDHDRGWMRAPEPQVDLISRNKLELQVGLIWLFHTSWGSSESFHEAGMPKAFHLSFSWSVVWKIWFVSWYEKKDGASPGPSSLQVAGSRSSAMYQPDIFSVIFRLFFFAKGMTWHNELQASRSTTFWRLVVLPCEEVVERWKRKERTVDVYKGSVLSMGHFEIFEPGFEPND